MAVKIASVDGGSPAAKAGLKVGDEILSINGIEILDYLDFMYASCQEMVKIQLADRKVEIANEDFMPLGIGFDTLLIDEPKACHNRCVFCFIDQLPKGMRETCYFKDDDYRLSFLQGNYVTMTNMTDADVERLLRYHIPRINVSVHTTDPNLRQTMLHNKRAGEVLAYLERFAQGGLRINSQIVLCPGLNDGEALNQTIKDLGALGESMESISVVPVGISAHREGLTPLRTFTKDEAIKVVDQVEHWQRIFLDKGDSRKVFLGDEFYILAGLPIPDYDTYEDFPQIENGVGLCSTLRYEFEQALCQSRRKKPKQAKTVVTGKIAQPLLQELADQLEGDKISVVALENHFFGPEITVTGLLTGGDLIQQLQGRPLGKMLVISASMLRHDEPVFLDDVTVEQVEKALQIPVVVVPNDGYALLATLLDETRPKRRRGGWR